MNDDNHLARCVRNGDNIAVTDYPGWYRWVQ